MQKLLAMGVVTISLASFGTCWAQSTSSPPQIQPPAKTAPTQRRTQRHGAACNNSRPKPTPNRIAAPIRSCGATPVLTCCTIPAPNYGKTAHGAYMCKGIAVNAGYHEAKE